jgi:hypothetical protein
MTLDLQRPIDNLRLFKSDLEAYYWERTGDGEAQQRERYQIGFWMRQIGDRAAALEDILMHMGSPTVIVAVGSEAEGGALRDAIVALDRWIPEGEPFDDVRRCVASVVHAADLVGLSAAGARPHRDG